jgi:hypothetical protein
MHGFGGMAVCDKENYVTSVFSFPFPEFALSFLVESDLAT